MGAFFPKTRALFPIFEKKRAGETSPSPPLLPLPPPLHTHSSYAPVPVLLKISVGAVKLFIKNH